jgi:flavin reductase (DIM6/NTAB) family NADH-FMN oxidoreductase RutF
MKNLPLAKVNQLLEPGPVVLLTTAQGCTRRSTLVAECFANLECTVVDTRLVTKYNLFVPEVVKAWTDPKQPNPKTIHHRGYGKFVVDGSAIKLKSKMR